MSALIIGALILLVIYRWLTKNYNHWKSKGVPFDNPFLIFGSLFDVARGKQHIFYKIKRLYQQFDGPYAGFYAFNQPVLLVRSPDLIKRILVKDFDKFHDRHFPSDENSDPIAFHTIFAARGDNWRAVRNKLTPVFTAGKIKMMLPLIKECVENLGHIVAHHHNDTKPVEISDLVRRCCVDIISSCAFGFDSHSLQDPTTQVLVMSSKLLDFTTFKRKLAGLTFSYAPKLYTFLSLSFGDREAMRYLSEIFKDTMSKRERRNIVRNDLIDLFINLKKNETAEDSYKFDDVKMAAQAIMFFAAGSDTLASAIFFTLYELALNPDIQDRLRSEIVDVYAEDADFTYDNLFKLKFLDMTVCESLRKYPFTSFLNREAMVDYVVDDLLIERGTQIMIPLCGLHFDCKYFPNPDKFDPQRFDRDKIDPYTYMPFGEGPRNCIGSRFGLLATKVALAYLIRDFAFDINSETPIPLRFETSSVFLRVDKKGIPLSVRKI